MRLGGVAGETWAGTPCRRHMDRCVEVVARFGDTVIDVAHVSAHESYRIGTAPNVELAIAGLGCFPIVDAGLVRRPVGVQARGMTGMKQRLGPDARRELPFGRVL